MTGTEIFKRTRAYETTAPTIRLHAPEWKLLLAYDGQRSLAEIALSVEIPFIEALPLTEKFLERHWIEEQPITLDQYLKRTGAAETSAAGSAVTPAVVLHKPKPESPTPSTPTPATPPPVPVVQPPPVLIPPIKEETVPLPPPLRQTATLPRTEPRPRPRGPLKINAMVDYIVSQAGNSSLGRLMVYRIFLRVPPQFLQAEDIVSVHLVNDPSVARSEALKTAIAMAAQEIIKKPLPDSIYSAA